MSELLIAARLGGELAESAGLWRSPLAESGGLAPTPRDVIASDGTAQLLRFRGAATAVARRPVLLVPSLINRWYVLDLRRGASLAAALVEAGHDVYCLDWGVPNDEDRYLSWDDVLTRLARMVRATLRCSGTGNDQLALIGYCMGGTLCAIHAALEPQRIAALVNLAGPIDFSHAGALGHMADARWFDADALAAAGNIGGQQLQSGFVALRPTAVLKKWLDMADRAGDRAARVSFAALEAWAGDNVAFPAAAYATYIGELYQNNALVKGEHVAGGRRVDLGAIRMPVAVIAAQRDAICPLPAARALLDRCASEDRTEWVIPGGHVGAVVGRRASTQLYPKLAAWLHDRLETPAAETPGAAQEPSP